MDAQAGSPGGDGAQAASVQAMAARGHLRRLGLPDRDLGELPASAKRFADGAQYRIEIPSVEGPEPFRAVLDAARDHRVPVHRVSQGSGMMLLTAAEIGDMVTAIGPGPGS